MIKYITRLLSVELKVKRCGYARRRYAYFPLRRHHIMPIRVCLVINENKNLITYIIGSSIGIISTIVLQI